MRKDYYRILGIPRSATPLGIRRAYRELVKRHHPDRVGPAGTRPLQDVVEAYEVLSDPARRRAHNDDLAADDRPRDRRWQDDIASEPLASADGWRGGAARPHARERPLASRVRDRSAFGDAEERLAPRALRFEIELSREESLWGCLVRLDVPLARSCPACVGFGHDGFWTCGVCGGAGRVAVRAPIAVRLPRAVRDGELLDLRLRGPGGEPVLLRFSVRVAERA
ncbi:MAG TPA: DnaJ domain-containing protein [Candidatus Binatia bacterium]|nr:DnaJ domain-containing protein [Candidatus Binatia bacterium]